MRDLDDVAADTTRCTNDEQRRTVPQVGRVDRLEGCHSRNGQHRRRWSGKRVGSAGEFPLLRLRVFGERSACHAEDRVADCEPVYGFSGGDDCAGHVASEHGHARPPHPGRQANEIRLACKQVPRAAVDAGSLDAHEHFVVGDGWHGNVVHPNDVGVPIAVMHCRAHGRRYGHVLRAR